MEIQEMKISGKLWRDIWEDEPVYRILDADQLANNVHISLITLSAYLTKFEISLKELKRMEGKIVTVEITEQ
jgi:hypothetical protein